MINPWYCSFKTSSNQEQKNFHKSFANTNQGWIQIEFFIQLRRLWCQILEVNMTLTMILDHNNMRKKYWLR